MANRRKPVATLRPHESANHPNHEICKANWLKLWKRALFALHAVLGLGCDGIVVLQIHLQQCWSHFWQGEQCKDKSTKCNFSFPHCHLSFHVFCRFDQASSKKHYTASHNVCSLWWSVRPEVSSSCRADTIHFCEPCRWFWIRRWGGASRHLSPQKVRCPVPITVFEPFRWILSWGIQVGRIPGRGRTERPDHRPRRVADSDSDVSSLKQDVERRANVASMYIESTLQIEPDFFLWWRHYNYHSVTSRCFFFSSRFGWGPPLLKNSSQRLVWSCVGPASFKSKQCLSFHDSCHIALEVRRRTELHTLGTTMSTSQICTILHTYFNMSWRSRLNLLGICLSFVGLAQWSWGSWATCVLCPECSGPFLRAERSWTVTLGITLPLCLFKSVAWRQTKQQSHVCNVRECQRDDKLWGPIHPRCGIPIEVSR